jgi:hypothetical protein
MMISRREARDLPIITGSMLEKGFVFAMLADIATSDRDDFAAIHKRERQWIIVSRLGEEANHISISTTGEHVENSQTAPGGIRPRYTLCGKLAPNLCKDRSSTFTLLRQPPKFPLAGIFFPADGCARLEGHAGNLQLNVTARFSHSRGLENGREVLKDVPDPAPAAPEAGAWLIDAERCSWIGDKVA